jgi:hypothetical protein
MERQQLYLELNAAMPELGQIELRNARRCYGGHIYPHVGLLDRHRAPSATAQGHLFLAFLPMSPARRLFRRQEALPLSFQLSIATLFDLRAWLCDICFWNGCAQTDKASMLDEIIDYVKFLQIQVKASMKC